MNREPPSALLSAHWRRYQDAIRGAHETNTPLARLDLANAEHALAARLDSAGVCLLVEGREGPAVAFHTGSRIRVRPVIVAVG